MVVATALDPLNSLPGGDFVSMQALVPLSANDISTTVSFEVLPNTNYQPYLIYTFSMTVVGGDVAISPTAGTLNVTLAAHNIPAIISLSQVCTGTCAAIQTLASTSIDVPFLVTSNKPIETAAVVNVMAMVPTSDSGPAPFLTMTLQVTLNVGSISTLIVFEAAPNGYAVAHRPVNLTLAPVSGNIVFNPNATVVSVIIDAPPVQVLALARVS